MARIVFDLDGTLIDSAPDIRAVANALLEREGRAPASMAEVRGFVGSGARIFVERMCDARDIPGSERERLLEDFLSRYEGAVELTTSYPGAVAALETLRAEGHRLGLCTNKPERPCRAVLAHLGLGDLFETVVGGDTLPVAKPDPAPLHAAFEALGAGARLYVGDSDVDAETARRAAVPFLFHTEGYHTGDRAEIARAGAFGDFAALAGLVAETLAGPAGAQGRRAPGA